MNKIKQNKITFSLILAAILVTFSSLTFLSLPVLFKYKSKVSEIEKNFYNNFKVYLSISGNISYKPFPKPHLLVEKAYVDEVIQYAINCNENCFIIGEMVEKCESSVFFEGNLKKWSTME